MTFVQRLIVLVALAVTPLAAAEWWSAGLLQDERETAARTDAERLVSAVRSEEARLVGGMRDLLWAVGMDAPTAVADPGACRSLLARISERRSVWLRISVADATGMVRCSSDRGLVGADLSSRPEVAESLSASTGDLAISEVENGIFAQRPHIVLAQGWSRGAAHGAVMAAIDLRQIGHAFAADALPADASLILADRSGRILASLPERAARVGEMLPEPLARLAASTGPGVARERWVDGSDRIVGYAPPRVGAVGGASILVGVSRDGALASIREASRRSHIIFLVTLTAACVVAWGFGVRFVRRPVRAVADAADRFGAGDVSARANLGGSGELSALGSAFDAMAAAVEKEQRRAEDACRAKTRFLAAASHDLRQPLQGALLFAEAAQARCSSVPGAREPLAKLSVALSDLRALLDELLDISRLESGVVDQVVGEFPLRQILEQVGASASAAAARKGLSIEICAPDAMVRSDPVLLGRILRNLLENAVRYTDRGAVRIVGEPSGGVSVKLSVCDTGPGISDADRARIWDEFQQLHRNPERDRRQGLGLGLSIVKKLSDLLGLRISVTSEPGKGSEFSFELPVTSWSAAACAAAGAAAPAAPDAGHIRGGDGRTVLLIDDDPVILDGLSAALTEVGFAVMAAPSGRDAAELVKRCVPDLLVADFRLRGGETGEDAARLVHQAAGSDLPGIILTGEHGEAPEQAARRLGMAVIRKPATARDLLHAFAALPTARRAHRHASIAANGNVRIALLMFLGVLFGSCAAQGPAVISSLDGPGGRADVLSARDGAIDVRIDGRDPVRLEGVAEPRLVAVVTAAHEAVALVSGRGDGCPHAQVLVASPAQGAGRAVRVPECSRELVALSGGAFVTLTAPSRTGEAARAWRYASATGLTSLSDAGRATRPRRAASGTPSDAGIEPIEGPDVETALRRRDPAAIPALSPAAPADAVPSAVGNLRKPPEPAVVDLR